jgi:cytochrome P450
MHPTVNDSIKRPFYRLAPVSSFEHDPLGFFTYLRNRDHERQVSSFRFGRHRFHLVHDPDLAHQVLLGNGRVYQREVAAFKRWTRDPRFLEPEGLFMPQADRDTHLRARKALSPAFRRARVNQRYDRLQAIAERTVERLQPGVVDVVGPLRVLTLEMALSITFERDLGRDPADVVPEIETLIEVLDAPLDSAMRERLRLLQLRRMLNLYRARESLFSLLAGVIARVRAEGAEGDDIISLLVRTAEREGLSDEHLVRESFGHLFSLPDSSVYVIAWILGLLAEAPMAQTRLAKEVDSLSDVCGESGPDRKEAPYTHAVVAEAMRLYPSGWRLGRWARVEHELGPVRVHVGDHVWVSPYTLQRDPRFWPQPDEFRPERWLDGSAHRAAGRAYIPFGGGPRKCLGEYVAWREVVAATIALSRRFRFRLPGGLPDADPSGALRPKGRRLQVELLVRHPQRLPGVIGPSKAAAAPGR